MQSNLDDILNRRFSEVASVVLWESGAVKINIDEPFKLASGNFSPIYINCRAVISDPVVMGLITAFIHAICSRRGVEIEMVAGGETAGIPFAAYLAQHLSRPMIYIRKAKKGYGLASLVEGGDIRGKRILLVEDLITDAGSKLHFINVIREAGGEISDVLVLFDRQQGGMESLREHGVRLHSVTDLDTTLKMAGEINLHSTADLGVVNAYLKDLASWHKERGLEYR